MFQTIITIIVAFFAFASSFLLGSRRQAEKDRKEIETIKADTEEKISKANNEKAKAKAEVRKEKSERYILSEAIDIITKPKVVEEEDFEGEIEDAETDEDILKVMEFVKADSKKRAEEVSKRYE